jgi:phosphocarrier protein
MTDSTSLSRSMTLCNTRGLHARAAARFAATAEEFASDVDVTFDGRRVNGKSIMGLMMLAAACGKTIEVTATGPDAEQAMAAITRLVADRFQESE